MNDLRGIPQGIFLENKNKKEIKEKRLKPGLIFLIIGTIILLFTWRIIGYSFQAPYDLDDNLHNDIPVWAPVRVGVDAVIDWYAVEERRRYNINVADAYYCMIWLDDGTYIGLKVKYYQREDLDNIMNATWDYLMQKRDKLPNKLYYTGWLRRMKSSEKVYFQDLLSRMGIGAEEYDEKVRFYVIDTTCVNYWSLVFLIAVACLYFFGIVLLIGYLKEMRALKRREKQHPLPQPKFDVFSYNSTGLEEADEDELD